MRTITATDITEGMIVVHPRTGKRHEVVLVDPAPHPTHASFFTLGPRGGRTAMVVPKDAAVEVVS